MILAPSNQVWGRTASNVPIRLETKDIRDITVEVADLYYDKFTFGLSEPRNYRVTVQLSGDTATRLINHLNGEPAEVSAEARVEEAEARAAEAESALAEANRKIASQSEQLDDYEAELEIRSAELMKAKREKIIYGIDPASSPSGVNMGRVTSGGPIVRSILNDQYLGRWTE